MYVYVCVIVNTANTRNVILYFLLWFLIKNAVRNGRVLLPVAKPHTLSKSKEVPQVFA